MGLEILALCTRYYKGFISYNKAHGISTMTKHMKQDHVVLLKRFKDEQHACCRSNLDANQQRNQ
jgi:hypothetical protein